MNKYSFYTLACLAAAPAFAESHMSGDAEAGAQAFDRQCVSCHVVRDGEGTVVAGRNARTGPNLYGVVGRTLGSVEDFRYGNSIVALGETGAVWNQDSFVAYVQDPTGFLREETDDARARSKMSFRVRSEEDALNIFAFLSTFGEQPEDMENMEDETQEASE